MLSPPSGKGSRAQISQHPGDLETHHVEKLPEASERQRKGLLQVLECISRHKGKEFFFFLTSGALLPSFLSLNIATRLFLVPQLPDERAEPCEPLALPACRELGAELAGS